MVCVMFCKREMLCCEELVEIHNKLLCGSVDCKIECMKVCDDVNVCDCQLCEYFSVINQQHTCHCFVTAVVFLQ